MPTGRAQLVADGAWKFGRVRGKAETGSMGRGSGHRNGGCACAQPASTSCAQNRATMRRDEGSFFMATPVLEWRLKRAAGACGVKSPDRV